MNKRHTVKFQNFSYVTLEPSKEVTEKELVLAAVGDLRKSGIKMSEKQKQEVEAFLRKYN
jgi:hypothetical protein